jgi:hypothetical protein
MKYEQRSYKREKFYAVRLPIKASGTWFYAYGNANGPALFLKRKDALAFRDELVREGVSKGKVVPVLMTIEETK